jgi:outer membrane receptor protein involved in Fe transport
MQPKYTLAALLAITTASAVTARADNAYVISGKILDATNQQALIGATVAIKGTTIGAAVNNEGWFSLRAPQRFPLQLVVSAVGYAPQEFELNEQNAGSISISLQPKQLLINQVVVSASRVSERILESPVSIEKLDVRAIRETPAPSFFDALENLKGVQMTTLSLGYKVPNTRGFSGTTNSRFLQMVDEVDNISPGIGAPVANAVGPTELDIESVELIPGAASALYGLNAVNGIANLKTKSPFQYEGLSVYQKTGVNHINDAAHGATPLTETAIRFAKVIGNKFAFKINAGYSQGYDWIANNQRDQNPVANVSAGLVGADNPGSDRINTYGDEGSDRRTITLNGKKYVVARTGYQEKDLADYNLHNLKLDGAVYYRPSEGREISYSYRIGEVSNLYQRGNRIQLDGLLIQQHKLEYKGRHLSLKGYYTNEQTGQSYNLRPLGENMDLAFKSNDRWYADYSTQYLQSVGEGLSVAQAHTASRGFADAGRYQPGTEAFDQKKGELIRINNWDKGAALVMKAGFVHGEGQYDFSSLIPWVQVLAGFNYRNYIIHPDGNSYINPASLTDVSQTNEAFNYYSYGGFVQLTKKLLGDKLKLTGSARIDKIEYFKPTINPRIAAVFTPAGQQYFRVSFQNGYRYPTLFEGFSYVDNGGIKRLGGLKVLAENFGVFENSYIRSSQDAFIAAVNSDVNQNGLTQDAAIQKNKALLKQSNYGYIKPEHINSFEVGYKGVWLDDKLFVDVDYYFNVYRNFIGQVELTKPNQGVIGTDDSTAYYAYDKQRSKVYRMWTNSTSIVSNQGASLGLTYAVWKKFTVGANVSYATLVKVSEKDALIPAFNTPEWITNISVGNREVFRNAGFNIGWRWQSAFDWQSPLANGRIPQYGVVDAQVSYAVPAIHTRFKLGASNLLNHWYYQYEGGPLIGGLYYLTIVFDYNLKKK